MKLIYKLFLTLLITSAVSFNAQAEKMNVYVNALITSNGDGSLNGILDAGDTMGVSYVIDTANPDADPSASVYRSTNNNSLETVFLILVQGPAQVSTSGTTQWKSSGYLDITPALPGSSTYLGLNINITGTGMVQNQPLPNFAGGVTGTIEVSGEPLFMAPGYKVRANVLSIQITSWVDNDLDGIGNVSDPDDDSPDNSDTHDVWELTHGFDPLVLDSNTDPDGDGVSSIDEYLRGDSLYGDNSGIVDAAEYFLGTDPNLADTDGDGLDDASNDNCLKNANPGQEDTDGDFIGDACDIDSDADTMPDAWELTYGLNPLADDSNNDSDSDGVPNYAEYNSGTNPTVADTDGDTINDDTDNCPVVSSLSQTDTDVDFVGNACDDDDDGDGMSDAKEVAGGLDPLVNDAAGDADSDGMSNSDEVASGFDLNPGNADTDGDGTQDGADVCPGLASANQGDVDADGVGDECDADSDGDGMWNAWEASYDLDILANDLGDDLDGDGLSNGFEYTNAELGFTPNNSDDDGDGMPTLYELGYFNEADPAAGLMPWVNDAAGDLDSDGFTNLQEYDAGTNPLDNLSFPSTGNVKNDFDNDGDSDLLFQASSDGSVTLWGLQDANKVSSTWLGYVTPATVKVIADVDGDNDADVLFQRASDTVVTRWTMQGGNKTAVNNIGYQTGYTLGKSGDLDNDGDADLVFENGSGSIVVWLMQGGNKLSGAYLGTWAGYSVKAMADVNNDGDDDLVLGDASGNVTVSR